MIFGFSLSISSKTALLIKNVYRYDNEYGYSNRVVDLIKYAMSQQ